ncbi:MAG: phospholipase/carboxylesterase, partial [Bradyrhizobium sp.]|nr:phospholipase/carboxylesterase [Bradyrhizobium sp.]
MCYETRMSDAAPERLAALLPPLLRSLDMLGFIARHFHPPDFGAVMDAAGTPDQDLRAVRGLLDDWPEELAGARERLQGATEAVLAAFDGLRGAPDQAEGIRAVF